VIEAWAVVCSDGDWYVVSDKAEALRDVARDATSDCAPHIAVHLIPEDEGVRKGLLKAARLVRKWSLSGNDSGSPDEMIWALRRLARKGAK
jgi:hypothetical protein